MKTKQYLYDHLRQFHIGLNALSFLSLFANILVIFIDLHKHESGNPIHKDPAKQGQERVNVYYIMF